jgi:hypothetical protein
LVAGSSASKRTWQENSGHPFDDNLIEKIVSGATKEIHVKENCGAMSFGLSDEDMVRLDKVSSVFR